MIKKSQLFAVLALGASVVLAGCMVYPVSVSPSSHYIGPNDTVTEIGPANGSAFCVMPLGIPICEPHQMGPAIDAALKSSGGDALLNVRVDFHSYNLMFVVILRTDVYGTAAKIRKGGSRG
ncbi:MAG: hypothetical protein HY077_13110 [Elusimicrobia bacterium]|nr:hypothetical protein [Elusimicrobiota bacterium]